DEVHVVSTDFLVEGVHFDLTYAPMKHVGYKAVIVNLSDIFAMNVQPFGITVSVAMSNRFTVEAMEEFYAGVELACERYHVDLLGGDTSSCHTGLVVSVTALGKGKKENVVYRSGAKVNDLICLSGDIGAAYAGLQLMEREKSVYLKNPNLQPDLAGYDYIVGRQLKPEAREDIIASLKKAEILPTAMIDVSDGLASDLLHICRESKVGASIYEEKLMLDHQVQMISEEFNLPALTMALNGGEDYELLFTVPLEKFDAISSMADVKVIGHVVDAELGVNIVTAAGGEFELEAQGWSHFSQK
ncbi:MAG TPA: thiamine-phosphate kinase, partial [Bacteroidetes bacterium]|nr:thiamine-phosphate kinase [Bacteroidota bacterium]